MEVESDNFAMALEGLLDASLKNIEEGSKKAVRAAAKETRKVAAKKAGENFNTIPTRRGTYKSGFSYKTKQKGRLYSAEVGNRLKPGLAHLLELGHAKVGGGRVSGRKHIYTAYESGAEVLMDEIEKINL